MQIRVAVPLLTLTALLAVTSSAARAAGMPEVKASPANVVPHCATPGRLMAMVKARNGSLDKRFDTIASDYMRHGEALGVRWDYAFFQMLIETGDLSYKPGIRVPTLKPDQYNFIGLGQGSNADTMERLATVSDGAKAHLQHVMVYAGEKVDDAVAERTRKVQEWGILTSWQKGLKGPVTYADYFAKWSPKSKSYGDSIEAAAQAFFQGECKKADPRPDLVSEFKGGKGQVAEATAAPKAEPKPEKPSGAELAKKAIDDARAAGGAQRTGLGAGAIAKDAAPPAIKVINPPDAPAAEKSATLPPAAQNASAAAGAGKSAAIVPKVSDALKPIPGMKCRVWTASYGGQRAIIIRAQADGHVNYTVLDVNDGQETREAEAYISAYAKGGKIAGEFQNQNAALDKAFELCPEG